MTNTTSETVQLILAGRPIHMLDYPQVAMEIAMIAHEGQVDKAGKPYIDHVARVVEMIRPWIRSFYLKDRHEALAAAWLHDVVEDTDVDVMQIAHAFPGLVAVTVDVLTRREGEVYADYILRIARSTTLAAQIIKRADLYDNRFRGTLPASMEMRYDRALAILNKATEGKEVWHV